MGIFIEKKVLATNKLQMERNKFCWHNKEFEISLIKYGVFTNLFISLPSYIVK